MTYLVIETGSGMSIVQVCITFGTNRQHGKDRVNANVSSGMMYYSKSARTITGKRFVIQFNPLPDDKF